MQGKLLRVLQDGEFTPVGSSIRHKADVRFVAATNEDMDHLISTGRFRKDLFYRIRGSWLHLPALRERREDIPVLIEHFLRASGGPEACGRLDEAALGALLGYDFPGNVRELKSIIRSALNLAQGDEITLECLPEHLRRRKAAGTVKRATQEVPVQTLAEIEKQHILRVYRQMGGNKVHTARGLGLGLNTLRRKLKGYGVG
jgi:DNA-binding NtrC family response regulator